MLPGSPTSTGPRGPGAPPIAITRDSKFLYSNNGYNELLPFQINADGSLTNAPVPSYQAGAVFGLVTHPTADFLYSTLSIGLEVYAVNSSTGALSYTSSVSLYAQEIPNSAVMTPNGGYLYQGFWTYNSATTTILQIAGFSVSTATGALSPVPGSPLSSVSAANVQAVDPTGKFLYVVYEGGVAAYSIDAASGELTAVPGSALGVDGVPNSAAIDASGKFLIVSTSPPPGGAPGNCLAVLSIDPSTGTVTPVPGSPFGPLQTCVVVAADPSAEYVYAGSSGTVSVLSIDQATGELALVNQATLPGAQEVSFIALTH